MSRILLNDLNWTDFIFDKSDRPSGTNCTNYDLVVLLRFIAPC